MENLIADFTDLWQYSFFKIVIGCLVWFGLLMLVSIFYFNKGE
jgi:hypothetical protein